MHATLVSMASDEQLNELARLFRQLTDGTPEREAYLERLAAEIREGRYEVDADKLAEKLIERGIVPKRDPQGRK